MAKPLRPFVRGGGYYPSKKWIPLVRNGGYTTQNGGETEPVWATASGAIASFTTPFAYPLKKLLAQINPVQDLHGQDAPYPAGGGKNLFNPASVADYESCTVNSDESITVTESDGRAWTSVPAIPIKAGTYTFSAEGFTNSAQIQFRLSIDDYANPYALYANQPRATVTFSEDGAYKIKLGTSASSYPVTLKVQIECGSTATAWSPYANICPISGHTGLSVEVTGVNIAEFTHGKGIDTGGHIHDFATRSATVTPIKIDNTRQYKYVNSNSNTAGIYAVWNGETLVRRVAGMTSGTVMDTSGGDSLYVCGYSGDGDVLPETCGVFFADQYEEFKPYTGTTTTVSWQSEAGTVYGGTATYNGNGTWTLVASVALLTLDSNITVMSGGTSTTGAYIYTIPVHDYVGSNSFYGHGCIVCASQYKSIYDVYYISSSPAGCVGWYIPLTNQQLRITSNAQTAEEAKQEILSSPYFIYRLAEPQTYTITTGELIETLVGQNNVWVTSGDVEVTYRIE